MKHYLAIASTILFGSATLTAVASAQGAGMGKDSMVAVIGKTVTWTPIEVPGFPTGIKLAVISGDPAGTGAYTVRLGFPAGYRFPAHWHPNTENATVLSGSLQLAMGDQVDDSKLVTYEPGDFLFLPATMPHFGGVKGETVIQLHGQGPFVINLAQPGTD